MESIPTNTQTGLERLEKVQGSLESASKEVKEQIERLRVTAYQDAVTNLMMGTNHFKWQLSYSNVYSGGTLILQLSLPDVYSKSLQPLLCSIPKSNNMTTSCWVCWSLDHGVGIDVVPPHNQESLLIDLIQKCELKHVFLGSLNGAVVEAEKRYKEAAKHVKFYEDFHDTVRACLRGEDGGTSDIERLPKESFDIILLK